MSDKQKLEILAKHVTAIYRENRRTQARLRALEAVIRENVPEDERSIWDAKIEKMAKNFLQKLLEADEDKNAGFAAWIDDRKLDDL